MSYSKDNYTGKTIKNTAMYVLNFKMISGLAIVAIGIYMAYLILKMIYGIVMDANEVPFMDMVSKFVMREIPIITNNGSTEIGTSPMFFKYSIVIILLLIASRLTRGILKIGVSLMSRLELKFLIEKLWEIQKEEDKRDDSKPDEGSSIIGGGSKII